MKKIRVAQVGLGAMGQMMVATVAERPNMELVGAFDIDKSKLGHDAGEVCGLQRLGVQIEAPTEDALRACKADVALHATGSFLADVHPELRTLLKAGLRTLTTCEELSYPYKRHPQLAAELDALARANGVPILGTGVNPGFIMDLFPLIATGICREVRKVSVLRRMDADTKRLGFQKKIGAGMSVDQFKASIATGKFGHIGLPESAWLLADGLGWGDGTLHEQLDPVISEAAFDGRLLKLEAGQVSGLRQTARIEFEGKTVIELTFEAFLGASEPRDETRVDGVPDIHLRIGGGVPGDIATAAVLVNSVSVMRLARPGLLTIKDMAPLHSTHL